jgi:hypothetical protein
MLSARVARLERNAPREAPCRECGGPPPPGSYRLEFDRGEHRDEPERCPACGRQLVFRMELDRSG